MNIDRKGKTLELSVLVVDDSAIIRAVVKKNLKLSGLDVLAVHEAANGEEAYALLERERVDVVFTDIHMPKMNGIELVEKIRERAALCHLPVFVISSDRSDFAREKLEELGIRGYMQKPFRPERFKTLIDDAIKQRAVG